MCFFDIDGQLYILNDAVEVHNSNSNEPETQSHESSANENEKYNWSKKETDALLYSYEKNYALYEERKFRTLKSMWKRIAEELNELNYAGRESFQNY